jgi:hypothetical protein
MLYMTRFNYVIKHLPGKKNTLADALSRRPDLIPEGKDNENLIALPTEHFINFLSEELMDQISNNTNKIETTDCYTTDNNIYKYQGRIVIPDDPNIKKQVLMNTHDHETSAHPRIAETIWKVSREVYWPGMATYIQNYIKGCAICQQFKINRHLVKPPMQPILGPKSTKPFNQISMDLITDLPPDKGYDSILSIVDHGLSKGIILTAM